MCKVCDQDAGFVVVRQNKESILTCKNCGVTKTQLEWKNISQDEINSLRSVISRQEKTLQKTREMTHEEQDYQVQLAQKKLDLLRKIQGGSF